MSLINDALKEASRAGSRLQPSIASGAPSIPMRPVEGRTPGKQPRFLLPVALVIVLTLAGWCFSQWWSVTQQQMLTEMVQKITAIRLPSAKVVQPAVTPSPTASAPSSSSDRVASTPVKSATTKADEKLSTAAASPSVPTTAAQPKIAARPFPSLKLQGVSYRKTGGSSALINGRIVSEGDEVEGVTIAKIESQSVSLEFTGQQKILRLR